MSPFRKPPPDAEFWARMVELSEQQLALFRELKEVLDDLARRLSAPSN